MIPHSGSAILAAEPDAEDVDKFAEDLVAALVRTFEQASHFLFRIDVRWPADPRVILEFVIRRLRLAPASQFPKASLTAVSVIRCNCSATSASLSARGSGISAFNACMAIG